MQKGLKHSWKMLLTVMMFVMALATGVKAQAATWVEINEENFPDKGAREKFLNEAQDPWYDYYKSDDGKFYIDVTGVTDFYDNDDIKDFDFLNKFTNLESVFISVKKTSITLPDTVKIANITACADTLTINAPGLTSLYAIGDSDNILRLRDVKNLENLTVSAMKDISGYGNLKKLKYVDIYKVQSTRINLTKCTSLTEIHINSVPKLVSLRYPSSIESLFINNTRIRQLDVRALQNLTYLDVSGNRNIRTLDVTKNKKLKYLNVSNSFVKSLDVRQNRRLTSFMCYESKLSDLKLGKNSKLEYIDVHSSGKMGTFDVSQCPKLRGINASDSGLDKLDVTKNKNLWSLNLADNKNLKSVNVTKCYKLNSLDMSGTAIKTLNVTKNRALVYLDVYAAKNIKRLNISKCPKLLSLNVGKSGISYINLTRNRELCGLCPSSTRMKVVGLKGRRNLGLTYFGLKKGSVVPLKDIIGSDYKLQVKNDNIRFNPKTMKLQIKKKEDYDRITLKKGRCYCSIEFIYSR